MAALVEVDEHHHIVDVRSKEAFARGHVPGATCLPLCTLPASLCALPPRDTPATHHVTVLGASASDCAAACAHIAAAHYDAVVGPPEAMSAAAQTSTAPSRRLWRPNVTLAECVERVEAGLCKAGLPLTALDVGCGSGRDAVFLALRGWARVCGVDSNPRLLGCADTLAELEGVPGGVLELVDADVSRYYAVPDRQQRTYGLVHVARFLDRRMFVPLCEREHQQSSDERDALALSVADAVAPGGFVVFHTFTEPSTKPSKPKHVLRTNELADVFGTRMKWTVHLHEERLLGDGRRVQTICAQKPLLQKEE